MPKFVVSVELIRQADLVIEADDALDARSKVGDFQFDPDVPAELIGWRITACKAEQHLTPAILSEDTALSLARKRMRFK